MSGFMKQKGIGTSVVVAIIVAIAIAGIGGYFALKGGEENEAGEEGGEPHDNHYAQLMMDIQDALAQNMVTIQRNFDEDEVRYQINKTASMITVQYDDDVLGVYWQINKTGSLLNVQGNPPTEFVDMIEGS